ncbi:type II toxin-antitoxin system YafO family toxin [Microbulbifer sp. 2304DJ12-6]|uniref:type II toxin-antitoxin system YafO family toxin n=1 Tax=Microbulbifer sp. 2304DJ12-6 TaxID=3233340 RepID=UPI0039B04BF4
MDVKVFISTQFKDSCPEEKLSLLVNRFKEYKRTGRPHPTFGRDTTYDFPFSVKEAGMRHIHIKDKTSGKWHLKRVIYEKTSNTALIYCEGYIHKNHFLLLGFLENAHETYTHNPQYLLDLAEIADNFRNKF